jgi:flavodoxin
MSDGAGVASVSRRAFLWRAALVSALGVAGAGPLVGCASGGAAGGEPSSDSTSADSSAGGAALTSAGRALVVYFSHTGENYGVGSITTGNTAIVGDLIADEVGADTFEIRTEETYPSDYDDCCDVAKAEQSADARPGLVGTLPSLDVYDTVFLGYPIWWGDMPMAVYSFMEACAWSGRTVAPFCTHAGSGLSGTPSSVASSCAGAVVTDGLAITGVTAQNDRATAERDVSSWLSGLGIA